MISEVTRAIDNYQHGCLSLCILGFSYYAAVCLHFSVYSLCSCQQLSLNLRMSAFYIEGLFPCNSCIWLLRHQNLAVWHRGWSTLHYRGQPTQHRGGGEKAGWDVCFLQTEVKHKRIQYHFTVVWGEFWRASQLLQGGKSTFQRAVQRVLGQNHTQMGLLQRVSDIIEHRSKNGWTGFLVICNTGCVYLGGNCERKSVQ